ncbi:hypothetical protein EYF80_028945 [Liparis tanakae]|uniref:Uncharacterized protein n=1 Tax=Liparis tanakae TaxID=230148 RepID=A0A4Z2H4R8_9TELE|nr:hypothetical protein EYF80_028945 [Liparis tanakae]
MSMAVPNLCFRRQGQTMWNTKTADAAVRRQYVSYGGFSHMFHLHTSIIIFPPSFPISAKQQGCGMSRSPLHRSPSRSLLVQSLHAAPSSTQMRPPYSSIISHSFPHFLSTLPRNCCLATPMHLQSCQHSGGVSAVPVSTPGIAGRCNHPCAWLSESDEEGSGQQCQEPGDSRDEASPSGAEGGSGGAGSPLHQARRDPQQGGSLYRHLTSRSLCSVKAMHLMLLHENTKASLSWTGSSQRVCQIKGKYCMSIGSNRWETWSTSIQWREEEEPGLVDWWYEHRRPLSVAREREEHQRQNVDETDLLEEPEEGQASKMGRSMPLDTVAAPTWFKCCRTAIQSVRRTCIIIIISTTARPSQPIGQLPFWYPGLDKLKEDNGCSDGGIIQVFKTSDQRFILQRGGGQLPLSHRPRACILGIEG